MTRIAQRAVVLVAIGAGVGCGTSTSDGVDTTGAGGEAGTTVGVGGAGGGSGLACLDVADQAACEAMGCAFLTGQLFAPPSDCVQVTPIQVCVSQGEGVIFNASELWYRDVADGRIVVNPERVGGVDGYTYCGGCDDGFPCDWCKCKGP